MQLIQCTYNHIFFFQTSWKDGLSKKDHAGIWSFLYYRERWYFFSSKIWSYSLGGKWKIIFLKKNTCKYDIFFKCSKKMVFSKKLYWNMIFLVLSGKMVFFPKKTWYFFFGREIEDDLFQEILGNMIFSVNTYRCYKDDAVTLCICDFLFQENVNSSYRAGFISLLAVV